jgi:hypothetical protein
VTLEQVANRGFNLLAASLLGLGGLLFGAVFFQEQDWSDRVDDGGFLLIAALTVVWYLWRDNRFRRSRIPVAVALVAVAVQVAGFILERDDPRAFGDNVGGMLYFAAVLGLIAVQHRATRSARPRHLEAPHG